MAVNKLLLIGGTTLAVALTTLAGSSAVSAHSSQGNDDMVNKIATKFNLKSADVQKVFDEERATRQTEHTAELKTKLDQAVKDGKITADQEAKLIVKLDEMHAAREKVRADTTTSATDRRAAMVKQRADFDVWLKANNIPADLLPQHDKGGGKHMGGGGRNITPATDAAQ